MNIIEGLRRIAFIWAGCAAIAGASIYLDRLPTERRDTRSAAEAIALDIARAEGIDPIGGATEIISRFGGEERMLRGVCAQPRPAVARSCTEHEKAKETLRWRQATTIGWALLFAAIWWAVAWCLWLLLSWVLKGFMRPSAPPPSA